LKFFGQTEKAFFISRPNRFIIACSLNGATVNAFLPNPGRLLELLLPGAPVHLERVKDPSRDLHFTAVAVEREGHRVVLHTHKTNDVARFLLETGAIPALREFEVVRPEVTRGNSRFDFLLKKGGEELVLEVKSCTLFSQRAAMFPDAVTARGKKHLEELARLSSNYTRSAVLFVIHWPKAEVFMPDFHTDLEFARAFLAARDRVMVLPIAVNWAEDLSINPAETRVVDVLWEAVEKEAHDRGSYLVIFRLPRKRLVRVGELGDVHFRRGYYIYVGSAKRGLSARMERHRRRRKKLFWHIDFLRAVSEFLVALPVRSEDDLECDLAGAVAGMAGWSVPGFGSSDCHCPTHLFGFDHHPLNIGSFHALLQHFRMERLIDKYQLIGKPASSSQ
jgi:sugar fermentation stimulation protein A